MKKIKQIFMVAGALVCASTVNAQWTVTGTVVHPAVLNNNVSVGTTVNGANLYVEKAAAVTLGIKSQTAGATMFMDKGAVGANAAFAYKFGGTVYWNSGMLGNLNFSLRNPVLNTFPLIVQNASDDMYLCSTGGNVGIGTAAPTTRLHVVGSQRIDGNLQVSNNSTFGASMNVNGNVTASGVVNAGSLNVSGITQLGDTVKFGTIEMLYDGGASTIGVNSSIIPNADASYSLGSASARWIGVNSFSVNTSNLTATGSSSLSTLTTSGAANLNSLVVAGLSTFGAKATINAGGINVVSGDIFSGSDLYTGAGNGVINCGGDSMNGIINIMSDFFTTGTSNLNANGDEDLFIGGDLEVVGKGYQTGGGAWGVRSDRRLKKDIVDYNDGLEQIMKIHPVKFKYNDLVANKTNKEYIGIIAQEMKEIAPYMVDESPMGQIVQEDENGKEVVVKQGTNYYNFDPNALWYMSINAIKQQQQIIQEQATRIAALEAAMQPQTTDTRTAIVKGSTASLEQNTPNPFNQQTTIRFNCADASVASIIIRDLNGNLIKSVNAAGKSEITINANELTQGTYTYTLEIGGRSVDTKLMIVTK